MRLLFLSVALGLSSLAYSKTVDTIYSYVNDEGVHHLIRLVQSGGGENFGVTLVPMSFEIGQRFSNMTESSYDCKQLDTFQTTLVGVGGYYGAFDLVYRMEGCVPSKLKLDVSTVRNLVN